jgi:RNA polymerase sigma factor (sigma-70 family)
MTEDPFVTHRSLLFTVAYEMLGSAADAEDVLQESWLRWADVDHSQVRDPRSYLVRVVTRQALNRLRTLARSREEYVGEWLPEPLLTSPDVAEDVELAESVSIAMLTVLETLGPTERAVFVLREVFEMPYGEIGEAIGKSAGTVRQIARRAREHVAARRPRVQVSRWEAAGSGGAVPGRIANRAVAGTAGRTSRANQVKPVQRWQHRQASPVGRARYDLAAWPPRPSPTTATSCFRPPLWTSSAIASFCWIR